MTTESEGDVIANYLDDGWEVAGYSVFMMAAGATCQNILLRKGNSLATAMVLINGPKELARAVNIISPKPPSQLKKGFFG